MMRSIQLAVACVVVLVAAAQTISSAFGAVILQNSPTGDNISPFGPSPTGSVAYGQVFTAPITGTLNSFTLYLNGGVGALRGAVGVWNGPSTYGVGYGESSNLFTSASVTSNNAGPYTFSPNVNVTAGQQYVAYLSVFGESSATGSTTMPKGTNVSGIDYFVWNNDDDPKNKPSWNYFSDMGDVQFSASFSAVAAVPEPSSLAVFGLGACVAGVGAARRRRREKQQEATA